MDYETSDVVVREIDGVFIVRLKNTSLTGVIETQPVAAEVDLLLDRGVKKLVLDFQAVQYAASAALGMLIAMQKKIERLGGKMIVSHSTSIAGLLGVSKTAALFTLVADPNDAIKLFPA